MFSFQQLLSHFHHYHQYLLSYLKVSNTLQYHTGLQEINFLINHLDCMLGYPRAATETGKMRYLYVTLKFVTKT